MAKTDERSLEARLLDEVEQAQPPPAAEQEPEGTQPVAAESAEETPVADEQPQPEEEAPTDLTELESFRRWQSAQDKKLSEARQEKDDLSTRMDELVKQFENLKAEKQQPAGPDPQLIRQQEEARAQLDALDKKLEAATDRNEIRRLAVLQDRATQTVINADIKIIAQEHGVDPQDSAFTTALNEGTISDFRDIENIALRLALKTGAQPPAAKPDPKQEQKESDKERQTWEQKIAELEAELRQLTGKNQVPGTPAAGSTDTATARRKRYQQLKQNTMSGALSQRIEMEVEHPDLTQ